MYIQFVYMWFQNARSAYFFFKIISRGPLLKERKRSSPSFFMRENLLSYVPHTYTSAITIATP